MVDLTVSCSPLEAANIVNDYIVNSGISAEVIDNHNVSSNDGKQVIVLIFEKYFMRNSSRASLTVTIDNMSEITNVHVVGSGGGKGSVFGFDWGAGEDFESSVAEALSEYIKKKF